MQKEGFGILKTVKNGYSTFFWVVGDIFFKKRALKIH
jgi:hypothetical protein